MGNVFKKYQTIHSKMYFPVSTINWQKHGRCYHSLLLKYYQRTLHKIFFIFYLIWKNTYYERIYIEHIKKVN